MKTSSDRQPEPEFSIWLIVFLEMRRHGLIEEHDGFFNFSVAGQSICLALESWLEIFDVEGFASMNAQYLDDGVKAALRNINYGNVHSEKK